VDKGQPVSEVTALERWLFNSIAPQRLATVLLGIFAGLALALAGLGAGLVGALFLGRVMRGLLFGVTATDPAVFAAAAAALAVVALVATWIPARRATRVEPSAALRYE